MPKAPVFQPHFVWNSATYSAILELHVVSIALTAFMTV